ncbi:ABC transporter permease [Enterococcus sp.]|uniref:ABC transporter permease n=1 Tax=Enterococcus sp. TaxID=35783 RepID=UPI002FCB68F3
MKFWKRGLKSVVRRKGRSLILFLVMFILGNVIAGAVAIQQSTKNVEIETKKQLGAVATIDLDYERIRKEQEENPEIFESDDEWYIQPPLKELEAIGTLPYVKYFEYSIRSYLDVNKIESVTEGENRVANGAATKYAFSVKGVSRPEMADIEEGFIKLEDGSLFSDKDLSEGTNTIIISQEVAKLNNLSVGDQVVFDVTGEYYAMAENESEASSEEATSESGQPMGEPEIRTFDFPAKVIGIFSVIKKEATEEESENSSWMAKEQLSTIYAPNKLVQELQRQRAEKIYSQTAEEIASAEEVYQTTYVLKTIDDLEAFREEANALLTNDYYQVLASSDEYDQVASSMKKLGQISGYVVMIAVAAALLIISLIVLLFLRDRKHELGIYLSIGETRGKIIGQILVELLLISAIALLLSLVTGNLLADGISRSLFQMDWFTNPEQYSVRYYDGLMGNSHVSSDQVQEAYQVNFSLGYIVTYFLTGLGTVLLSAIVPLLYILRLNPKKIMM